MRVLDFITTAAAVGVFGYFVWKVILPKLGELELPYWQPPPTIEQQAPPTPPASTNQLPPAQQIADDPETEQDKPKSKEEQPKASLVPSRSPPAAVATSGGTLLWDSNTHGKWNSGKRVVTAGDGGQGPDGKGLHTAASGDPTLTIDGNGVAHLESSKWGRIYIYAKNYNSRLEGNFMFETNHGAADNISIKMRSRHGNNNHPQGGSGKFGGIGFAFHPDGEIELAAEIDHDAGTSADLGTLKGPPLTLGQWHKFAISTFDGGGVNVKVDVDGKTIGTKKWASPHASATDKASFNADSYFWIRLNCHDGKRAKAAFSNLRLYDLGASSGLAIVRRLMIDEPYLYNGYYHGRRL